MSKKTNRYKRGAGGGIRTSQPDGEYPSFKSISNMITVCKGSVVSILPLTRDFVGQRYFCQQPWSLRRFSLKLWRQARAFFSSLSTHLNYLVTHLPMQAQVLNVSPIVPTACRDCSLQFYITLMCVGEMCTVIPAKDESCVLDLSPIRRVPELVIGVFPDWDFLLMQCSFFHKLAHIGAEPTCYHVVETVRDVQR